MKSFLIIILCTVCSVSYSQERKAPFSKSLQVLLDSKAGLRSNSISDIVIHKGIIYLGTGKGLSVSSDGGSSWATYDQESGIGKGGVSAFAVNDTVIWVATAFDSLTSDAGSLETGGGLAFSKDGGRSWTHFDQPGDTPVQNITFDIALHTDGSVWITSFGGGTQRTLDNGISWEVVPPDTFFFDPLGRLNHRAFSTISTGDALWVGTAGGINKSLDNGRTWTNFNHQNQALPVSGNFVVAIASQIVDGHEYIWAATREAQEADEVRGVSVSEDGGLTWRTTLHGAFAHNFAFDGDIVFVLTDLGVYKSLDFGITWAKYADIYDEAKDIRYLSTDFFAGAVEDDHTLWIGGPDGLASTEDDGMHWNIFRGTRKPGQDGEPEVFAYPSPFSPFRHNKIGKGDGHIRIQYNIEKPSNVTIRIYDFAMELVQEVSSRKARIQSGSFFELWDGRNSRGDIVANGVYFFSVELSDDGIFWGKFIVMD